MGVEDEKKIDKQDLSLLAPRDPLIFHSIGKNYGIANSNHYCGFFSNPEEALEHINYCKKRREEKSVVSYYGPVEETCRVCEASQVIRKAWLRRTFPYGTPDGMVKKDIVVVQYNDYDPTA